MSSSSFCTPACTISSNSLCSTFVSRPSFVGTKFVQRQRSSNAPATGAPAVVARGGEPEIIKQLNKIGVSDIVRVHSIGGGCINEAYKYETDKGDYFVKVNKSISRKMFDAEFIGLEAMYLTQTVRVPKPIAVGSVGNSGSFFVMEFLGSSGGGRALQRELGEQLARMHLAPPVTVEGHGPPAAAFGFWVDNTIGSTPQSNKWGNDWIAFYREERLRPQLALAHRRYGERALAEAGERLMDRLDSLFEGVDVQPALLHGDLWSGNYGSGPQGEPVIFDPASYYGHSEAELSIMKMFGGFGADFFEAYHRLIPKQPGFEKRIQLYQLYHYLNHLNLFGRGYYGSCTGLLASLNS